MVNNWLTIPKKIFLFLIDFNLKELRSKKNLKKKKKKKSMLLYVYNNNI